MTEKCCSKCIYLRGPNLERTGSLCVGQPTVGVFTPVIKTSFLTTFYCQAFSPKVVEKQKPHPEELREAETEKPNHTLNCDIHGLGECDCKLPPIRRRFV